MDKAWEECVISIDEANRRLRKGSKTVLCKTVSNVHVVHNHTHVPQIAHALNHSQSRVSANSRVNSHEAQVSTLRV